MEEEDYQSRIRHDLRNKIQIIQGYLELMEDEDIPKSVQQMIKKLLKAAEENKELLEEWKNIQTEKNR